MIKNKWLIQEFIVFIIPTIMGDFLVDDWESLVDKDIEEIKAANNIVEPPKE